MANREGCGKVQVDVLQGAHGEQRRNTMLLDDSVISLDRFLAGFAP